MDGRDSDSIGWPAGMDEGRRALVRNCRKFAEFVAKASESFDFRGGWVRHVVWFGPRKDVPGFILFEADDARTHDGHVLPGQVALLRGGAAALLLVLETPDGKEWAVLVRQPRFAIGEAAYVEILAGMTDGKGFKSTALSELEEEVGADLGVAAEDLHLLDVYHTTPGLCDEEIRLYGARKDVSQELVDALRGREGGLRDEGERITVGVVPLEDVAVAAPRDGKAKLAYYAYMALLGRVARPSPAAEPIPAASKACSNLNTQ